MATLEQQLKDINKSDKSYIKGARKDLIKKYAIDHFGDDFKLDMTRKLSVIREEVLSEIDRRLGKVVKEETKPTPSPELSKKRILFRKFDDDPRNNLPPYEEVFNEDGTPKLVLCISNKTIWEPSPGMIKRLGIEFEACDKDGIIRRKEDYDRYKRDTVRDSD